MEPDTRNFSTIVLDAMRAKNISVEKLSQLTGISDRYVSTLIDEDFKKLPAAPYVHGYVLRIAEALGMDGESLWQEYLRGSAVIRRSGRNDTLPQNRFLTPNVNKKAIGLVAVAIVVIAYGLWRLPALRGTPDITLYNIQDMMVVATSTFTISGKINPADQLTINRELVYPDKNGAFSKIFTLRPDEFNTFDFKVTRFLGRENTTTRQIFYKTPTSTPVVAPEPSNGSF